jgi:hypothetical protein
MPWRTGTSQVPDNRLNVLCFRLGKLTSAVVGQDVAALSRPFKINERTIFSVHTIVNRMDHAGERLRLRCRLGNTVQGKGEDDLF